MIHLAEEHNRAVTACASLDIKAKVMLFRKVPTFHSTPEKSQFCPPL